jgi:serine protease SohB
MAEIIATVAAFLGGAYALVKGILILVLLVVCIMAVMSVIGLIASRGKSVSSKFRKKHGLMLYHDKTTDVDVSTAIKCREKGGYLTADPADDENAATPDALCATEKPVAVLRFTGDTMANGRHTFSRLVDEVVLNKAKFGGVVVVVESPGGGVSVYGLMYAQVLRLKDAGLHVRVCVDNVAASGGYLMSLPADVIMAAPLSMVGSIGVVSEFLNFHEFLTAIGITPLTLTAGARKRTLTPFGAVDQGKIDDYTKQLVSIHDQFKALVARHRPNAKLELVGEGDHWTAQESVALGLGLVDEIGTSADYLLKLNMDRNLVFISEKKNRFEGGLLKLVTGSLDHVLARIAERTNGSANAVRIL